jgi:hypothetical protein
MMLRRQTNGEAGADQAFHAATTGFAWTTERSPPPVFSMRCGAGGHVERTGPRSVEVHDAWRFPNNPLFSNLLTISPLHISFALSVFSFFIGAGSKKRGSHQIEDNYKWQRVNGTGVWQDGFCSVFIGIGTSDRDMDEVRVARMTAICFGLLWIAVLSLTVLNKF